MKLALFDLDGTLLPIDSDHAFGEFLVRLGWADGEEFRRGNDAFYAQYLEEALDIAAYVRFATAPWRARRRGAGGGQRALRGRGDRAGDRRARARWSRAMPMPAIGWRW